MAAPVISPRSKIGSPAAGEIQLTVPAPIGRKEVLEVAKESQDRLEETIEARKSIKGNGQEWAGEGNVDVNVRRGAISVLESRLSKKALAKVLPSRGGKLLRVIQDDLAWLARAERQRLSRDKPFDLTWAENGSSTAEGLSELAARRGKAAVEAAKKLASEPGAAHDASNDGVLVHLELDDPALRAQVLADTLLQFRARRRSSAKMDSSEELKGAAAKAQGRIASSGPLAAFEQRLACQELESGTSLEAAREYALLRMVVASHPHGTTNGIFRARNSVALLLKYLGDGLRNKPAGEGEGLGVSVYDAIHKNYSANTPRVVDHYLRHKVYGGGPVEHRLAVLSAAVDALEEPDLAKAKKRLDDLAEITGQRIPGTAKAATAKALRSAIFAHLESHTSIPRLKQLPQADRLRALRVLLDMHGAVCFERPSDRTLEANLFYAGRAWPEVAALIHALRAGDQASKLEASGRARTALRAAFDAEKSGFDRQMLWRLDRQVELLQAEILGASVTRAEKAAKSADAGGLSECLVAVRAALRGVIASGLESIRSRPKTASVEDLEPLLGKVDAMLAKGKASPEEIRSLLVEVYRSASEVAETVRGYFHRRAAAVHFSGIDVELDPEHTDNLVKETALHYLLALSQAGMTHGLFTSGTTISADKIEMVSGLRVLNSIGPAVYGRVLVADDLEELRGFEPKPDDFCIVHHLDEKKMVAVGGLLADTADAPGGYSHLSVFAKGHGISALALPNLATAYEEFFTNAQKGGGLYVDDRDGRFVMMPLAKAIEQKLVKADDVEKLRPGFNKDVRYFDTGAGGLKVEIERHGVHLSDARETRVIELYVPDLDDKSGLGVAQTFAALSSQPLVRARQLAGEKGAVLAHLEANADLVKLGVGVPSGASIPPFRIAELLKKASHDGASVFDRWTAVWQQDPKVGAMTGETFTESSFYTDREYRQAKTKEMRQAIEQGLTALLLEDGAHPTAEGLKLLEELSASGALAASDRWIARSSYTGEDRPNKSGAGQYESYPNLKTSAERLRGIIGVIVSGWEDTPVDNNVQLEINLAHIWPSVLVQRCLEPTVSGVAVSRGDKGELGEVSYQAVVGFGGGVAGGKPEEGVLAPSGNRATRLFKDQSASLLTPAQQKTLKDAVLAIEREFNENVEPGQAHAVDVEWAIEGGKLFIVQARVLTGA